MKNVTSEKNSPQNPCNFFFNFNGTRWSSPSTGNVSNYSSKMDYPFEKNIDEYPMNKQSDSI